MRTIKFLGIAVALAAVSVSANAQGGRRFEHFTGFDELVRLEARQIEQHQMRPFAMVRAQRMGQARGMGPGAMQRGAMQVGGMQRGAMQAGSMQPGAMGLRGGRFAGPPRGRQMMMAGGMGPQRAFRGGADAGMQFGARAGFRAGARAGLRAAATPEQAAFAKQFGEQRQAIRAQVLAGTLTREQARTQMQAWAVEHRPKK